MKTAVLGTFIGSPIAWNQNYVHNLALPPNAWFVCLWVGSLVICSTAVLHCTLLCCGHSAHMTLCDALPQCWYSCTCSGWACWFVASCTCSALTPLVGVLLPLPCIALWLHLIALRLLGRLALAHTHIQFNCSRCLHTCSARLPRPAARSCTFITSIATMLVFADIAAFCMEELLLCRQIFENVCFWKIS